MPKRSEAGLMLTKTAAKQGEPVIGPSTNTPPIHSATSGDGRGDQEATAEVTHARLEGGRSAPPYSRGAVFSSASADPPPRRATLREINTELSELASRKQLHPDNIHRLKQLLAQIEQILNDAAPLVASSEGSRRLYERALKSQRRALALAGGPNRSAHPAGWARNRGLTQGGREVLGGAPGSRRRH